jgi:hypothetical protein
MLSVLVDVCAAYAEEHPNENVQVLVQYLLQEGAVQ